MLDYINYCFIALSGLECDSLYAVSPSKSCLWQWPQIEFVMQGSQQWGILILCLFPLPSTCRHSLPQRKLSAKPLPGAVPMIWALFSSSWKHPLEHPRAASLHCFLQYWKKVWSAFCTTLQFDWINQNCLCFSKSVPDRGVHLSIHFPWCPAKAKKAHSKFCSIDI